ncbi:MAG: DUF721 domain-containing protein [Planctomycetota bacterium]
MKHIGEVIKKVRSQLLNENPQKAFSFGDKWDKVAGASVAQRTRVMGFKQKVLYVKVESPALLNELCNFKKETILEKLKTAYPEHKIRDIKFVI